MSKRWPYLIPVVVIAALFGVFAKRLSDVEHGPDIRQIPSAILNTPMPAFDLPGLPGRKNADGFKTADLKGQVSLVNVWGSWCIGCIQEHPVLLDLSKKIDVPIHGIAWRDDPAKSLAWLQRNGDPYALVGQDPTSKLAVDLGVTGAPETYLVDAQGVIRFKWANQISPEVWRTEFVPRIENLRSDRKSTRLNSSH